MSKNSVRVGLSLRRLRAGGLVLAVGVAAYAAGLTTHGNLTGSVWSAAAADSKRPPTKTNNMWYAVLGVQDIDTSVKFYTEGLGMHVKERRVGGMPHIAEILLGYTDQIPGEIMLLYTTPEAKGPNRVDHPVHGRVILEVVNARAMYDKAIAAGGRPFEEPKDVPGRTVMAGVVIDPAGNYIELVTFR